MNILKKTGIGVLIIVVVLALISLFLPAIVHVERSVVINAPIKTVFKTVNNLKSWINWSYWDQIDPKMISEFEGPESGVGAIHRWNSEHEMVGNGSMTITETAESSKILTSFEFDQTWITPGGWLFEETEGGSKATVFMDMEMPFYARIPGMFMKGKLEEDFDKTLAGLKNYTEGLPVESASAWTVETITTTPAPVMCMKVISNGAEYAAKLGNSYEKIMAVMARQDLKQSGPIYAFYHKWSPDTVEMEPGVMVDKPGKTEGDVLASEMKPVKAIKVDYYGGYTEKAHYFMDEWARKNNVAIIGAPWEEYVTDSKSEPDTAKWLTRIYYPVQ